jgi:nuclear pore complex protein Nup98-Nup96
LAEKALDHGHYYTDPPIETIAASDNRIIPNLIVGRHGFGEIQFERPVDLSGLSSLDELLGKVVQFRRTICHVYPEGYQEPPAGEGLNVPAMVRMAAGQE